MNGITVEACRSCDSARLEPILSLGTTPIANSLVSPSEGARSDPRYPLEIVLCADCSLVQLGYILPADVIFGQDYPYFSSFSDMFSRHAARHVEHLIRARGMGAGSLAVEVASNDGYLLRHFVEAGVPALGIDPAPGPAAAAEQIGVRTIVDFFGTAAAERIVAEHGHADVIIANNVLAHVPNMNDFVSGLSLLLADDGLVTIENPYVRDMVEKVEFDTIYHEHYSYFSCTAIWALMERHGLHLNDVEYFADLHGGTLRWHVGKAAAPTNTCRQYLEAEDAAGISSPGYYQLFSQRVRTCQHALRALLEDLRNQARTVAAYGAAAKGATLLNSSDIDSDLVAYVVDRNTNKHGKLMPGCRLPIRPVEVLMTEQPDDVLILAWNFADEIIDQQRKYINAGGAMYVPVPVPRRV